MTLSDTKALGYLLLTLGVAAIIFSGSSIYLTFTRQTKPVQVFNVEGVSLDLSALAPANLPLPQTPQKTEIIPSSFINDFSNLAAHYLLMSFFASLGFKLSSLGVNLLRPIEVKLKT